MAKPRKSTRHVFFETLELRCMFAQVHWLGTTSDNWHDGANWDTGTVPDNGDVAIFDLAAGSTVKLYADQTKLVGLYSMIGALSLGLNGFEFSYTNLSVTGAVASSATFTGPGSFTAPNGATIFVGGDQTLKSASFIGLNDIVFSEFKIGSSSALQSGSGAVEIDSSTLHGNQLIVGNLGNGQLNVANGSELILADAPNPQNPAEMLDARFILGQTDPGTASIVNSMLSSTEIVIGDGTDDTSEEEEILFPNASGSLQITNSQVSTSDFYIGYGAQGEVSANGGSSVVATGQTTVSWHENVHGTLNVGGEFTALESKVLYVAVEQDSDGELTIDSGSKVFVQESAVIGAKGVGTASLGGADSLLEAGAIHVGSQPDSDGKLYVATGAQVTITDDNRPPVGFLPSLWIGAGGLGLLQVSGNSQVDIKKHLELTSVMTGDAVLNVSGGSNIVAEGEIKRGAGNITKTIDGTSTVKGLTNKLTSGGTTTIKVKNDSVLEGSDVIELGAGAFTDVGLFAGGLLQSNATVSLDANMRLHGDSSVVAGVATRTLDSTAVIDPATEAGGVAKLTFQSPEFDLTAGATTVIDAPAAGMNDHVHATGAALLGGTLDLNLAFTPAAWTAAGTAGDWIHVLSAAGSLTGEFAENLPTPPAGQEWQVIYDRDDVSSDVMLEARHPNFASQPWLGNGTFDVVVVLVEGPYDLIYGDATLDEDEETSTITLGTGEQPEEGSQPSAYHGVSLVLAPAAEYVISFDFDLSTWDSYNEDVGVGTGYWDSFSVSVTERPFPQMELHDPLPFPFVWGGAVWGDAVLDTNSGSMTLTFPGDPNEARYLNLVLDTATDPTLDELYPSWGEIVVTSVVLVPGGGGEGEAAMLGGAELSNVDDYRPIEMQSRHWKQRHGGLEADVSFRSLDSALVRPSESFMNESSDPLPPLEFQERKNLNGARFFAKRHVKFEFALADQKSSDRVSEVSLDELFADWLSMERLLADID